MKDTVGIIVAMNEELYSIKEKMEQIIIKKIFDLEFLEGNINNTNCVIVKSGVGKVNAARTTQVLIDNYKLKFIINVGVAGSLNDSLDIGDIVIADSLVQHDFDITAFGREKGYITDIGKELKCDKVLIEKAKNIINKIKGFKANIGIIASGDIFCTDIKMKEKIHSKFKADCVEMEGAAIAQVCTLDKIPFIVIRSISDKPNGNNQIQYEEYLQIASERYAEFIDIFLN